MSEVDSPPIRFKPAVKVLIAAVFLLVFGAAEAYAAVSGQMVWSTQYTSVGSKDDFAQAITVSPDGSIYVTGASGSDYATVKYSPAGSLKWAKRYHGPGSGYDEAVAVALDKKGAVYVTGSSSGAGGSASDYATIKYGPLGGKKWVSRFNSRFNGEDEAAAIAVGSTGVYVTGYSQGNKTRMDYATIKYGFDSRVKWVKRYNSPGNGDDRAVKIAVDTADNVYVTGSSASDWGTVKYNSAGALQWAARYNHPDNVYYMPESPVGLVVDGAGNVTVAGPSETSAGPGNTVVQYDAGGTQKWVQRYDGPAGSWPEDIGLDPSGNIYVAGISYDGSENGVTLKYDSAGVRQWLRTKPDFNSVALAVDGNGNVVVTGEAWGSTGSHYGTVKYDTNGNLQWEKTFGGKNYPWATDVAVNGKGATFVTGSVFRPLTGEDFATVKYAP